MRFHGPTLTRRTHRPVRRKIASPGPSFTPAFSPTPRGPPDRPACQVEERHPLQAGNIDQDPAGREPGLDRFHALLRAALAALDLGDLETVVSAPDNRTDRARPRGCGWCCETKILCTVPPPVISNGPRLAPGAFGVSGADSVIRVLAREMALPVLTSLAASLRFASVTRFMVPTSSSLPQRPQFETSLNNCSNSATVCGARFALLSGATWARPVVPRGVPTTQAPPSPRCLRML